MYPDQQQQQHNNSMFNGMSMGGNSFNYPQQNNTNTGFPNMTHQNSWPGSDNSFGSQNSGFSAPSFSQQEFRPAFNNTSTSQQPNYGFSGGNGFGGQPAASNNNNSKNNSDLFGLKETLKKNNKLHKYQKGSGFQQAAPSSNAFSGLVASQWNA
jgi:hypothetical protein